MSRQQRFGFGRNWRSYSRHIDEVRVTEAVASLEELIGPMDPTGKTFLDVGSGSGLFSAAATRLGFEVHAFDYDPVAVETTRETLSRFGGQNVTWTVETGDALDIQYLDTLPRADVAYAWGVLHHTGDMWKALDNVAGLISERGLLVVALYNDQGWVSRVWRVVKRAYVRYRPLRPLIVMGAFVRLWGRAILRDTVRHRNPLRSFRGYGDDSRGMSAWHDLIDWVGGYPFEVASPQRVMDALHRLGFKVEKSWLIGDGSGNNQFVARRGLLGSGPSGT